MILCNMVNLYVYIGNGCNNSEASAVRNFSLLTKNWKDEQLITRLSKAMTDEEFRRIKHRLQGNDNIYIRSIVIFPFNF